MKTVSQRRWTKGLVATVGEQSQPQGSVQRISNMVYNKRGSLVPCDGSLIISLLNGALVGGAGTGPWTEIALFQPANVNRYYIGIKKDYTKHLGAPVGLAVVDGGAGGVLANATYRYKVTGLDGAGGETTPSAEVSFANPGAHKANVSWTTLANAVAYNVYRTAAGGAVNTEVFLAKVTTNTFVDDGSIAPGSATPPTADNTQQCVLYVIPGGSYADANIIALLPADFIVEIDGTPGGSGGGGGGTGGASAGAPPNPSGGIPGNVSPLPQIVQFANKAILALGNAFPPQQVTDGAPPVMAALTNTFTTAYPDWIANALHSIGDVILPSVGNVGNFVFKALQGGASGAAAPTWPQIPNAIVADNNIIWQNTGVTNANVAPRGAAHACVYAGCLWILNTNPTTTADNLDGPSCLAMSNLNNPNSWNPLNRAFLDRDDGDYGTALQPFTIAESGIPPTGSLIAFKNFKTFQINGVFGSSNFSIQQAQTDMGCIASRSVQFLPGFGIARLAHLGVAIFDGTRDKLISEDIRPFIFGDPLHYPDIFPMDWNFAYFSKGAQCANPPMYMLAIPLAVITNLPSTGGAGGFSLTTVHDVASDWQPGLYFFRVYQGTASGFTAISAEVQVTVLTQQDVVFTPPGSPLAGTTFYRVCVGTQSGNYTRVQDCSISAPTTFIGFTDMPAGVPPAFGTGALLRILCYDLVFKNWTIMDLPFGISVLKQVRAPGTQPITVVGGFSDGSMRRLQAGDLTFDGAPITWNVQLPTIEGDGGTERLFHRRVIVEGGASPTAVATITVVATVDGEQRALAPVKLYFQPNNRFTATLETLLNMLSTFITISGSSSDGTTIIDAADHHIDPLPQGAPPIFS